MVGYSFTEKPPSLQLSSHWVEASCEDNLSVKSKHRVESWILSRDDRDEVDLLDENIYMRIDKSEDIEPAS